MHCTVLHCIVLYCIVLYRIVLSLYANMDMDIPFWPPRPSHQSHSDLGPPPTVRALVHISLPLVLLYAPITGLPRDRTDGRGRGAARSIYAFGRIIAPQATLNINIIIHYTLYQSSLSFTFALPVIMHACTHACIPAPYGFSSAPSPPLPNSYSPLPTAPPSISQDPPKKKESGPPGSLSFFFLIW